MSRAELAHAIAAAAGALGTASLALDTAAKLLGDIEPDAARASVPDRVPTAPAVAAAGSPPPAAAPNTALGVCPVHRSAWTVKAGGISKAGKPYPAFWKCKERGDDGYCNEKPTKAWADSHPIPLEEVPF